MKRAEVGQAVYARGHKQSGVVVRRWGAYVYVRLDAEHEVEAYDCELDPIEKVFTRVGPASLPRPQGQ